MGQIRATKLAAVLGSLVVFLLLGSVFAPAQVLVQQKFQVQAKIQIQAAAANGRVAIQVGRAPDAEKKSDSPVATSVLPQPDRETLKQLKDARILIQKERYGEAVRILGDILSLADDSFFPIEEEPTEEGTEGRVRLRALREEAEQMLGAIPSRGLELYELQFGAQAKQMLEKSMQMGDVRGPANVSRRFFYTAAGTEATWLSGLAAMDEGRWRAAIISFERFAKVSAAAKRYEPLLSILKAICMEQAGESEEAQKTWQSLRDRSPKASIQLAGEAVPLFKTPKETFGEFLARTNLAKISVSGNLLQTLAKSQTLPFGTPERNASVDASFPLLKRLWKSRITDQPSAEVALRKQWEAALDDGTQAIPRFQPLVVDGILFCRSLDSLVAIDIKTGKRLWESRFQEISNLAQLGLQNNPRLANVTQNLLSQIWNDSIFGQLTSDTRNVYAVETEQLLLGRMNMMHLNMRMNSNRERSNTLIAFDTKTGQRRWSRSTGPNSEPFFFLGPPLPLDGFLYSLAECQSEVYLVALLAASGEIEWTQRIALIEPRPTYYYYNIPQYSHAQMPALLDGVMVCPTGNGAIIAIEPNSRAFLWAHCYDQLDLRRQSMVFINGKHRSTTANRVGEELVLHENRVFSVPIDSQQLQCLDLRTGKQVWKKDFLDSMYLGGVYKDKLLVVGTQKFQTLDTETGNIVGECLLAGNSQDESPLDKPEHQAMVIGRGFRNGELYYMPTSAESGSIAVLDIEQCKITHQVHSHEPHLLGNLIAVDDQVFSQSLEGVEAFHQLKAIHEKIEEQLLKDPNDLTAMSMQAELFLVEGKIDEAIEKFRYIYQKSPTPEHVARWIDAFCVGLEEAYPTYREKRPEIEPLLQTDEQRSKYWSHVIRGEVAENHLEVAADACFQLAEQGLPSLTVTVNRFHTVRQDRFVEAQLASIYEKADPELQKKLAGTILAKLESAFQTNDFGKIKAAWNNYAFLAPVFEHYGEFAKQLWTVDPSYAELIFERTIRYGTQAEAATAMVEWAELLREAGRIDEAAACYREAILRWREVPLLTTPAQTAFEKVAALDKDDPVRNRLDVGTAWPEGHLPVTPKSEGIDGNFSLNQAPLYSYELTSPIFRDKRIFYDGSRITLRDQYNREIWVVSPTSQENSSIYYYSGNNMGFRCVTMGHMIFLELQDRVVAIDSWNMKQPRIAWESDCNSSAFPTEGYRNTYNYFQRKNYQGMTQSQNGRRQGMLGLPSLYVGSQLLAFSGSELTALDLFDGSVLWCRRKIPLSLDYQSDGTKVSLSSAQERLEQSTINLVDGSRYVPPVPSAAEHQASGSESTNEKKLKVKGEEAARQAGQLAAKLFMSRAHQRQNLSQRVLSLGRHALVLDVSSGQLVFSLIDNTAKKVVWKSKGYNAQARWALLDRDYIGIVDLHGNLELFRITDGKTLFQHKLAISGTVLGIYLHNMGDRIGVIVSTPSKARRVATNVSYNQIPLSQPITGGTFYSFYWDGRPGMPKYPEGISVDGEGVLLDPPEQLPVVTFLQQSYIHNNRQQPNSSITWRLKLLVLDSRSGEELISKEVNENLQAFKLIGDPEQKTVDYHLNSHKFSVQFK